MGTELFGYDAASLSVPGSPLVDAIIKSGASLVSCYTDGAHATAPENVQAFVDAKLRILANHENAQTELLGGYAAGVAAAGKALKGIESWPITPPCIYFSVDFSVAPDSPSWNKICDAFQGINDALKGTDPSAATYAEGALIAELWNSGLTHWLGWLSASTSFPGYDRTSKYVGMWQQIGSNIPDTDRNVITNLIGMGTWCPPVPSKRKVETMYTVEYLNGLWVVDTALSSRVHITSGPDFTQLSQAKDSNGDAIYTPLALSDSQMAAIPDKTVYPPMSVTDAHTAIAAVSTAQETE